MASPLFCVGASLLGHDADGMVQAGAPRMKRQRLAFSILAALLVVGCSKSSDSGGSGAAGASGAGGTSGSSGTAGTGGSAGSGGMGTGAMGGSAGMGGSGGEQKLPIGSACTADADCGTGAFMCMTDHPDGYCIKLCNIANGDADCPSEAVCQFDGSAGECHAKCDVATDCRAGYTCAPAAMDPTNQVSHAFCDMM